MQSDGERTHQLNKLIKEWGVVHTPVIPVLGRWRQEDQEFKVILCYIEGYGQSGPPVSGNGVMRRQ